MGENEKIQIDDVSDDEMREKIEGPMRLSKCWSISSSHVPTFTGGKVTHCRTPGIILGAEDNENFTKFLILPINGNLSVVDVQRGSLIGLVRDEDANNYEDDDGIDTDSITAYCLSWNDNILITCSQNNLLRQYKFVQNISFNDSKKVVEMHKNWGRSGHSLPVVMMEFHISNVFIATGSIDGTVRIWDIRGPHITHVFRPFAGGTGGSGRLSVTALRWQQKASKLILAIGRDDGSITIHNLKDRDLSNAVILRDHVSAVTCLQWCELRNNDIFVTAGRDAVVNLWVINRIEGKKSGENKFESSRTYRKIQTLPVYEQVEGMEILPSNLATTNENDIVVAIAGSKGQIRLFKTSVASDGRISALSMLLEQPKNQSFGQDRGGYMDMFVSGAIKQRSTVGIEDSEAKLVVVDAEHSLSFLSLSDKEGSRLLHLDRTIIGNNDEILDLKVVPSANDVATHVVVATNSAQVRIFDIESFSCDVLDRHTATVLAVDISPCGRYIATCGKDKTMRIWNYAKRECVALAVGHTEAVGATALSKKKGCYEVSGKAAKNGGGAFAITASGDRTLKRWNLPGAVDLDRCITRLNNVDEHEISLDASHSCRAHEKDINIVSIAPNDSLIATGSQDKTVKLWHASNLSPKATLRGHKRGVWDCQFSGFDRVLATASADCTIKLWSLSDCSCVRTFQGHLSSVLRVRFLSGGLQLMSSGADGLIKLWTIRTNECEATMEDHIDKVWALDLSSNNKMIISGGSDSQIHVWKDKTEKMEHAKRIEQEEVIIMDQKLANHLRHNEYSEALDIALDMDKPHLTLKVLTSVIDNDGFASLKKLIEFWSIERVERVLRYCREWNTRARNSHIAMIVVNAIVKTFPAQKLAANNAIVDVLKGLAPYAERHIDRLEKLYTNSYLMDFALCSLGHLDTENVEETSKDTFIKWEATSKLVLPLKYIDGKTQTGGKTVIGVRGGNEFKMNDTDHEESTIGESDSSSDSE